MQKVPVSNARGARRAGLVALTLTLGAGVAQAADVYALTVQGMLIRFDTSSPGMVTPIGGVSGAGGMVSQYAGIDFRPATSQLYLAEQGMSGPSRLYTLSLADASATLASTMSTGLSGEWFGVDFNPVPDRLRTTSNTGQNLRTNVDTGLVAVDMPLGYAAGDMSAGVMPSVVGSAYTNSLFGAVGGSTTLYNLDAATGNLVTQIPPNNGTLNTVGGLGVALNGEVGFDIYFNGSSNAAYASIQSAMHGGSDFYRINLMTGAATFIGTIGGGVAIRDFSVIPSPMSAAGLGLGASSALIGVYMVSGVSSVSRAR